MAGNTAVLGAQFTNAAAITPNDNTVISFDAFIVAVGGTITIRARDSAADVQLTVAASVIYPIAIIAVRATGTAATGIAGLS